MTDTKPDLLRAHAEDEYAAELAALAAADERPRPPRWRLSPWAVTTYLLGGELDDGTVITPKYLGSRRLMEIAAASLATDRALLLGVPAAHAQSPAVRRAPDPAAPDPFPRTPATVGASAAT